MSEDVAVNSPPQKPARFQAWYEDLINFMLLNPAATQKEMAAYFDKSANYISLVTRSDVFQERLAERRRDLAEAVNHQLVDKMGRVALRGLDIIADRLSPDAQQQSRTTLKTVSDITDKQLQRLGYGGGGGPSGVQVNVLNVPAGAASPGALREAQQTIRQDQAARLQTTPPLLELTPEDEPPSMQLSLLDVIAEPREEGEPEPSPPPPLDLLEEAEELGERLGFGDEVRLVAGGD